MSLKFHSLRVKKVVNETADAVSVHFEKPAEGFDYIAGQYLTLKVQVGDEELRRAYSLCSSPTEDEDLIVAIKRVSGGKVSNWIPDNIKEGDTIEVYPPLGKFTVEVDPARSHHYILLGGGSGITPLMSIIRTVLKSEPNSKMTLVYGNRNIDSIIFADKLEWLDGQYSDRFRVIHALNEAPEGWTGLTGMLTRQVLLPLFQDLLGIDNLKKTFHMCGPAAMMEEAETALNFLGVDKSDIKRELFTAKIPQTDAEPKAETQSPEGNGEVELKRDTYEVTVILDGKESVITVPPEKAVLDVAIQEGLDPPFACQLGICTTCRAMCHKGAVEMDESEGLTDDEIEEGFVLTCQAHPLMPGVVLEYK